MAEVQCFMLTKSNEVEISLRRFCWRQDTKCPLPYGYHNAEVVIARGAPVYSEPQYNGVGRLDHDRSDSRWPMHCACGYQFTESDQWQYNEHFLWKNEERGVACAYLHRAPPGAMWSADWMGDEYRGPDGLCLVVMTPGGDWPIDGPAYVDGQMSNPHGWTRSGTPPNVTAAPSILIPGKYHGWLKAGILKDC